MKRIVDYYNESLTIKMKELNKYKLYYTVDRIWLELKDKKILLASYLKKNNYNNVAIYGYGKEGRLLYSELKENNIKIKYIIDQNAINMKEEVEVKNLKDELPEVDLIIITVIDQVDKIQQKIKEVCNYKSISLVELVFNSGYY